jgi:two-component system sensor histidine kinase KdpD
LILAVATICFSLSHFIDYKVVALILLMTLSLIAMFFDILPVLAAAMLSAIIWIYFFIPPIYTWIVKSTDDLMMFFMYFIIAMVNTMLTFKIRAIEKAASIREEKENTLRLYNTMLNSLSHELRTPISTIIGATDNLQDKNEKLSEAIKTDLIGEISKASLRLNAQVENLLNMSRLESEHMKPNMDWCDVNELIHHTINSLKEELEDRLVIIKIDSNLPLCKLDRVLMEQVIKNLVLNANIYTEKSCLIKIFASIHAEQLQIIIEDNGEGFPESEMSFVFDKFYRLKHAKAGGTGLGLSIAKGFVEVHHGSIFLENKTNGGAKFTITIPAETNYINNYTDEQS